MLWLPWATHRKVWHKMAVWTATQRGWPSKLPFCAILFYASPRATKACKTRLWIVRFFDHFLRGRAKSATFTKSANFGNGKCELSAIWGTGGTRMQSFGKGTCKLIANFSATRVTSLPSFSLSLSRSYFLSLSLSHTGRTSSRIYQALPHLI